MRNSESIAHIVPEGELTKVCSTAEKHFTHIKCPVLPKAKNRV
jgi:hypothetical protein